jgi:hypothetical protein
VPALAIGDILESVDSVFQERQFSNDDGLVQRLVPYLYVVQTAGSAALWSPKLVLFLPHHYYQARFSTLRPLSEMRNPSLARTYLLPILNILSKKPDLSNLIHDVKAFQHRDFPQLRA